jgi:hypothetical protein
MKAASGFFSSGLPLSNQKFRHSRAGKGEFFEQSLHLPQIVD